ncbi:MAG: hypothetical protein ABFR75_12080 [Acidobacteriota bacterium]
MYNEGVTVEDVIKIYDLKITLDQLYMNSKESEYVQTGREWIESYIDDWNFFAHHLDPTWEKWGGDNLIEVEQNDQGEWISAKTKKVVIVEEY